MDFVPYLDWVDVPDEGNPPEGARMVSASDLLRYERGLGQAAGEVAGLAARLAALEYDSGPRSLNSLVSGRASGDLRIRRLGRWVILTAENLVMTAAGSGALVSPALPFGWRPISTQPGTGQGISSRIQVTSAGNVQAYSWTTAPIFATVMYPTNDSPGALVGSAL